MESLAINYNLKNEDSGINTDIDVNFMDPEIVIKEEEISDPLQEEIVWSEDLNPVSVKEEKQEISVQTGLAPSEEQIVNSIPGSSSFGSCKYSEEERDVKEELASSAYSLCDEIKERNLEADENQSTSAHISNNNLNNSTCSDDEEIPYSSEDISVLDSDEEHLPSDNDSDREVDNEVSNISTIEQNDNDDEDNILEENVSTPSIPIWNDDSSTMKNFIFSENPGLKVQISENNSPYDFFCIFANDEFYDLLVTETNFYANELFSKCTKQIFQNKQWKDVTACEMKVFLGLLFHMGHIEMPHLSDYWRKDILFNMSCFSSNMSRNRFLLIMRFLHFCRNPRPGDRPNPTENGLFKIQPLLDFFNSMMDRLYYPHKELSLDDSMVLWRGRLIFRQYVKNKKHKYGIKLYQLTEPSGLVLKTLICGGVLDGTEGKGHSGNVVLHLMEGKLNKGHSLYMDNFYNSYHLSKCLLDKQTYCTGTLRSNRKYNPKKITCAKLKKGQRKCQYSDGIAIIKWHDRRDILMISTEFTDNMVDVNSRGQVVSKPEAVAQYNVFMGGIDKKDQMMSYYPCERKAVRWYKKLGIHLMQTMMFNSFCFYKKHSSERKSYYDFRLSVVRNLLSESSRVQPSTPCQKQPSYQLHVPCKLQANARGKIMRKRCRMCFEQGKRKDTVYSCEKCPNKPALCLEQCFAKFHSK